MGYIEEFSTIEILKKSDAITKGVDSFALSIIKAERQMRKLFTFLIYQYPCFNFSDITNLRDTLSADKRIYFDGFINGFDSIYMQSICDLVGSSYITLKSRIDQAILYRNKIFHGQLTNKYLSSEDLFGYVDDISNWCEILAANAQKEIGYDGFDRNSFRKSSKNDFHNQYKFQINSAQEYSDFLKNYMRR